MKAEPDPDGLSGYLTTVLDPGSAASEAYRSLRTNLLYARVDKPPKVIVITSPGSREGKSITCANLGVVLAQTGKSTLLMDCNFRTPALHRMFELPNEKGITDVLAGPYGLRDVAQEPQQGLEVVTTGPLSPAPAELLSSRRFAEFLSQARQMFEFVLIDSPPIGLVSDPLILAAQSDGVLLVVNAQNTRKVAVRRSVRNLEGVGARALGTVMSNVRVGP